VSFKLRELYIRAHDLKRIKQEKLEKEAHLVAQPAASLAQNQQKQASTTETKNTNS